MDTNQSLCSCLLWCGFSTVRSLAHTGKQTLEKRQSLEKNKRPFTIVRLDCPRSRSPIHGTSRGLIDEIIPWQHLSISDSAAIRPERWLQSRVVASLESTQSNASLPRSPTLRDSSFSTSFPSISLLPPQILIPPLNPISTNPSSIFLNSPPTSTACCHHGRGHFRQRAY